MVKRALYTSWPDTYRPLEFFLRQLRTHLNERARRPAIVSEQCFRQLLIHVAPLFLKIDTDCLVCSLTDHFWLRHGAAHDQPREDTAHDGKGAASHECQTRSQRRSGNASCCH